MSNKPIMKVTFKLNDTTYSVLSIWRGKFPGTYSVSRDKGTEKYPAISILDVLKAFAGGQGFINVSVESEREQRGSAPRNEPAARDDWDDSEPPF